ncbi:PAS domain-containing protein [Cupriavidus basilensis]
MRGNFPVKNEEYVLPDGEVIITRTDTFSRITYANEAFVRSSGFSRAEIIGEPQNIVRHPDMPAKAFEDMWETLQDDRPWTGSSRTGAGTAGSIGWSRMSRPSSNRGRRLAICQ